MKHGISRETLLFNNNTLKKWRLFSKHFGLKVLGILQLGKSIFWQYSGGYPERILWNKNICGYYIAYLNQNFARIRTFSKTRSLPVMMTVTTPTFPVSLFIINNIRCIGQPDSLPQESEKSNYYTTARGDQKALTQFSIGTSLRIRFRFTYWANNFTRSLAWIKFQSSRKIFYLFIIYIIYKTKRIHCGHFQFLMWSSEAGDVYLLISFLLAHLGWWINVFPSQNLKFTSLWRVGECKKKCPSFQCVWITTRNHLFSFSIVSLIPLICQTSC